MGCQPEKKEDNTPLLVGAFLASLQGNCGANPNNRVTILRGTRTSVATPPSVNLADTAGASVTVQYCQIDAIRHSIGVVRFTTTTSGRVLQTSGLDVADFSPDSTATPPLIYKKTDFPLGDADLLPTSSFVRTATTSTNVSYTINDTGTFFILFYLASSATPPTTTLTRN